MNVSRSYIVFGENAFKVPSSQSGLQYRLRLDYQIRMGDSEIRIKDYLTTKCPCLPLNTDKFVHKSAP